MLATTCPVHAITLPGCPHTNPADSYRAADDALAALKDKLNRQRMAGDLNPGDRITVNGQVQTIAKADGYAPYMRIQFTDGTWFTPKLTDLFAVAD